MSATALYKALLEANVPEAAAEKAVEELDSALAAAAKAEFAKLQAAAEKPVAQSGELVTKADLKATKSDLKAIIAELVTKSDLKAGIAELKVRMLKWVFAAVGVLIAAMGVVKIL